jgi:hypothetical protein
VAYKDVNRKTKFLAFDGRTAFPLLLFMLWPRMTTLYVLMGIVLTFFVLDRRGMPIEMFFRYIRSWLTGGIRTARPWWRKQMFKH